MLSKYRELLDEIEDKKAKFRTTEAKISKITKEIASKEKQLNDLYTAIGSATDKARVAEVKNIISSYEPLKQEAHSIEENIKGILRNKEKALNNLDMTDFEEENIGVLELVEDLEPTIDYIKRGIPDIQKVDTEEEIDVVFEKLDELTTDLDRDGVIIDIKEDLMEYVAEVNESKENSVGLAGSISDLVGSVLLFPSTLKVSSGQKVAIYLMYIAGLAFAVVNAAAVLLIPCGIGIKHIISKYNKSKYYEQVKDRLERFLGGYERLLMYLDEEKQLFEEEQRARIIKRFDKEVQKLQHTKAKLEEDYATSTMNVVVDEELLKQKVQRDFKAREENYSKKLEQLKKEKEELGKSRLSIANEINDLYSSVSDMKEDIIKVYMSLEKVGTSKLMMKEFLLGFDDQDIIAIKHKGKPMSILYDGENSFKNSTLINMIIAQCYGNMSPNILQLTIVDYDYTCRDYSMYKTDNLKDMVQFVTLQNDITNILQQLHGEIANRLSIINKYTSNIESYNKRMLDLESFTLDYKLIIFQNAPENIFDNTFFLQLCRTGPVVGIMPIVFISRTVHDKRMSDANEEKRNAYITYLKEVNKTCWSFNQSTNELEEVELKLN